ncbi:glycoside hydrolase family 30 protein [Pseudochryseolinea flava]|uniref:glycoside hydrolase family 30 protein n=1 Tax=Pseudochryseolinea flava TaxID=2059302 RepID=UPI001402C333|nr:glycoside hydrolase family 30 protein [Pseudochryseolinea flava]
MVDSEDSTANKIVVNLNEQHQKIQNFGASDAWTCQFVGQWPEEKRSQIADWLFSTEVDAQGKPKGIGLSLWRFNIGAGSAAQDNISDEWRRTPSFLLSKGKYDWNNQPGQLWFVDAAKQRGVSKLLGFTNSPPIQFTKNGKAYSSNGEEANVAPENYLNFATFLIDVVKAFKARGTSLDYISPFNEPQWDWTGNGQEGSPYKNTEIYAITKIFDSLLVKENLNSLIQIGEAGKLNYLYEKADKVTRGDQINQFFHIQSPLYLGALEKVDRVISGHSYFTSAPVETMRDVRTKVTDAVRKASVPLEFWQSEYCILGDQEEVKGGGKDTGIVTALYVARLIHHDLTMANASAWHWWLAVTAYDYKDGLIYVDKNKANGNYEDTKLLWALGNYSRFINAGATRVTVSGDNINVNNPKGLMMSAYVNPGNKELVVVAVNYGDVDLSSFINVEGAAVDQFKGYLTGPDADAKLKPLALVDSNEKVFIPKKSIVTFVGSIK